MSFARNLGLLVVASWLGGCAAAGGHCDAADASTPFVGDTTPLVACPGRTGVADTPQAGACDAGFFPDVDYACGPPAGDGDGGFACSCRRQGDLTCRRRCACDDECTAGEACTLGRLFWGSDTPRYSVGLCRAR